MPKQGALLIAKNLKKFGGGFIKHVNKTMGMVSKVMDAEVTKNMSLTDHTQADLDAMGNPYAKKHGPEGFHIHDPWWQVHTQTGELLGSKRSGTVDARFNFGSIKAAAYVLLDEGEAPHAMDVIYGTSVMVPRPFLLMSIKRKEDEVMGVITKNLRDMVHNFRIT